MTPTELIERQLEAYNARDLDAFAATYADDIRIFRMPSTEPAIVGMEKLREVYKARFSSQGLHAEIVGHEQIVEADPAADDRFDHHRRLACRPLVVPGGV